MESSSSGGLTASLKPETVLQSLVDLTSGATLLKAGRSVRTTHTISMIVFYQVCLACRVDHTFVGLD